MGGATRYLSQTDIIRHTARRARIEDASAYCLDRDRDYRNSRDGERIAIAGHEHRV